VFNNIERSPDDLTPEQRMDRLEDYAEPKHEGEQLDSEISPDVAQTQDNEESEAN
jgi:hypothetical protein